MFGGRTKLGMYLTFMWVVLMISVSFRPSTISSYTYMGTFSSMMEELATFLPTFRAMVVAQLPDPIMQIIILSILAAD